MDFVMYASPLTLPPSLLAWLSFFSNGKSNQLSTLRIIMIRLGSQLLQISIYILKYIHNCTSSSSIVIIGSSFIWDVGYIGIL